MSFDPLTIAPLLSAEDISQCVAAIADQIAPVIDDDTVCVCLLTGGLWFSADLMRALAVRGCHPQFDALWLSSYGNAQQSSGQVEVRGGLQRPVAGRQILLMDDVFDTGLSLSQAVQVLETAGARQVLSAVFARKPWPTERLCQPDFVAWEAPARFLVGYGMDAGGQFRGRPGIGALD
jgi:hypoxanthine phosphoribosyltransferase